MSTEAPRASSGEAPVASRESRTQLSRMLIIGAIASAVGIALSLLIDWFPVPASAQAGPIDTLWDVLLIASVPVFVLVMTVVLYSVITFRMRPGEELKDGPPIHGNTKLEIIWTAIPAILLVGLCTYAYVVLTDIEKAEANSMEVRVVGEQFTWTFFYRGEGGEEIASPQLYLPVDRPVNFTIQSKDVIHDFWVPAFRMKIDAVPGIDTHLRVTPNREGEYAVVCAELCGLGHSTMRQSAHVLPQGEFDSRLAELQEGGGGGGERRGRRGGHRRRAAVHRRRRADRVRVVPHADRGGHHRHDGAEPRRGAAGPQRRADPAVDRRARRRGHGGLQPRADARLR